MSKLIDLPLVEYDPLSKREPNAESIRLAYELSLSTYQEQCKRIVSFDDKAKTVLATSATAVSLLLAAVATTAKASLPPWMVLPFVVAASVGVIAAILAVVAMRPTGVLSLLSTDTVTCNIEFDAHVYRMGIMHSIWSATESACAAAQRKSTVVRISQWFLMAFLVLATACASMLFLAAGSPHSHAATPAPSSSQSGP